MASRRTQLPEALRMLIEERIRAGEAEGAIRLSAVQSRLIPRSVAYLKPASGDFFSSPTEALRSWAPKASPFDIAGQSVHVASADTVDGNVYLLFRLAQPKTHTVSSSSGAIVVDAALVQALIQQTQQMALLVQAFQSFVAKWEEVANKHMQLMAMIMETK